MSKKIYHSVLALAAITLISGAAYASDVTLIRTASPAPQNLQPESYPPQPALFVVRKGDATVYLFGSAHVLAPKMKWRTSTFDEALAKSDTIWLKSTITDMANPTLQWAEMKSAYADDDKQLTNILSKAEFARLERLGNKLGLDVLEYNRLHPWVVSDILNGAKYRKDVKTDKANSIKISPGVEEIIQGMRLGRPIKSLEDTKRHVLLFSRLSPDDEKALLMQTITEMEQKTSSAKDEVATIQEKWRTGDLEALDRLGNDVMERDTPGLFNIMLVERNKEMTDGIVRELEKGKGTDFVAVGALHLSGSKSVIKMLEDRGYQAERLYDTAEPVSSTTKNKMGYPNYRVGVGTPLYLNISLKKDINPDKVLLRFTVPKVVHGCVEISPIAYKLNRIDEGLEIQTGSFLLNIHPWPPSGGCGAAAKTAALEVPLSLADLKSKKSQILRLTYPGGADFYTLSYEEGTLTLSTDKDPWYYRSDDKNMSLTGL